MAIVKMSKFNLFVLNTERASLLQELQKFKYVHFLDLKNNGTLKELGCEEVETSNVLSEIEDNLNKVNYSLDLLSKYDSREKGLKALRNGVETIEFDELEEQASKITFHPIYEKLKELSSNKEKLEREILKCKTTIDELTPWVSLDTPIHHLSSLKTCTAMMGTIPKKLKERLETELSNIELTYYVVINEDKDNVFLLIISHNEELQITKDMLYQHSFSAIQFDMSVKPKERIVELEEEIQNLKERVNTIEQEISELAVYLPDFELLYDYLNMKKIRVATAEKFVSTDYTDIIEGYIPANKTEEFKKLIKENVNNQYHLEISDAKKDDPNVPVLLENSKFNKAFESMTTMFATPKYDEIDPTPYFSLFYAIFFGMMVADLGYGLLMFTSTFVALKYFNLREGQRNFIQLFYYLSFSTMFWGAVYGSFFGGVIPLPALINIEEQYTLLLILSIGLGIVHIFYALGVQAYMHIRDGNYLDALFDVGFWYLSLIGGITYIAGMYITIPSTVRDWALIIMIIGMVGIVLTGGRSAKGIGGKLGLGLYSLYGISGYVGDFVSYSRLMALALSGGFIASAINMMVGMLFDTGFIGVIFGIIVFLVGQAFNIFLSLLSAYVHTIRLTYVEFFGKFYEGGGRAFQIFRSKPKYVEIK